LRNLFHIGGLEGIIEDLKANKPVFIFIVNVIKAGRKKGQYLFKS